MSALAMMLDAVRPAQRRNRAAARFAAARKRLAGGVTAARGVAGRGELAVYDTAALAAAVTAGFHASEVYGWATLSGALFAFGLRRSVVRRRAEAGERR